MNAFFPAAAFSGFSYQKPISRYEQSPTPSQPTKRGPGSRQDEDQHRVVKRFRVAK
jgi:hypothetical protein